MKSVVIFGSTGRTGLCVTEAAVKKGLQVRAFVRDPAKIPEHLKGKVEIFEGNVLEPDSVMDAVEGMDAVIIALGTGESLEPTSDLSEGTKNIIESMRCKNVKRVSACISAFLFYQEDKIPARFRLLTEDHRRMFLHLKESGLDWVAAFPPHISDEPSRETIIEVNPKETPGRTISKWDLGTILVDCLTEPKYYKSVIGLCNVPQ